MPPSKAHGLWGKLSESASLPSLQDADGGGTSRHDLLGGSRTRPRRELTMRSGLNASLTRVDGNSDDVHGKSLFAVLKSKVAEEHKATGDASVAYGKTCDGALLIPELKLVGVVRGERSVADGHPALGGGHEAHLLNLEDQSLGDARVACLATALVDRVSSGGVTEIALQANRLGDTGFSAVARALAAAAAKAADGKSALASLDLSENNPGPAGIANLCRTLRLPGASRLRRLDLARCALKQDALVALADGLRGTCVSWLDLTRNPVVGRGASALAGLLKSGAPIETLGLSDCSLFGTAAAHVLEGCGASLALGTLDLSLNRLSGQAAAAALVGALGAHPMLAHADLGWCGLGETDVTALGAALARNHILVGLHLEGNAGGVDARGFLFPSARPRGDAGLGVALASEVTGQTSILEWEPGTCRVDRRSTTCWMCGRHREHLFTTFGRTVAEHVPGQRRTASCLVPAAQVWVHMSCTVPPFVPIPMTARAGRWRREHMVPSATDVTYYYTQQDRARDDAEPVPPVSFVDDHAAVVARTWKNAKRRVLARGRLSDASSPAKSSTMSAASPAKRGSPARSLRSPSAAAVSPRSALYGHRRSEADAAAQPPAEPDPSIPRTASLHVHYPFSFVCSKALPRLTHADDEEVDGGAWSLHKSVFAARPLESDGQSFLDRGDRELGSAGRTRRGVGPGILIDAFRSDLALTSANSWIDATASGPADAEAVKSLLQDHYGRLCSIYRYYSLLLGDPFSLTLLSFSQLLHDTGVVDDREQTSTYDLIFTGINSNSALGNAWSSKDQWVRVAQRIRGRHRRTKKTGSMAVVASMLLRDNKHTFMRHEFIAAIPRLADAFHKQEAARAAQEASRAARAALRRETGRASPSPSATLSAGGTPAHSRAGSCASSRVGSRASSRVGSRASSPRESPPGKTGSKPRSLQRRTTAVVGAIVATRPSAPVKTECSPTPKPRDLSKKASPAATKSRRLARRATSVVGAPSAVGGGTGDAVPHQAEAGPTPAASPAEPNSPPPTPPGPAPDPMQSTSLSEKLGRLLSDYLVPFAHMIPGDDFRKDVVYRHSTDCLLKDYLEDLQDIFAQGGGNDVHTSELPAGMSHRGMTLREFTELLEAKDLLDPPDDSPHSALFLSVRDAREAFVGSLMQCFSRCVLPMLMLSFVDFLEACCRCAHSLALQAAEAELRALEEAERNAKAASEEAADAAAAARALARRAAWESLDSDAEDELTLADDIDAAVAPPPPPRSPSPPPLPSPSSVSEEVFIEALEKFLRSLGCGREG